MVWQRLLGSLLLALLVAGCRGDAGEEPEERTGTPQPVERVTLLTEGEALAVLGALNQGAADYTRAVLDSVRDADVRRLLAVVRTDHEALQAELEAIADSLEVVPTGHAAAEQLRLAAQERIVASLGIARGRADGDVLQRQIELNQQALAVFDSTLIPGTREPLLAQYLAAARPTLGAHLQRARQVEVLLRERAATASAAPVRPAQPAGSPVGTPEGEAAPAPRPTPPAERTEPPPREDDPSPPDTSGGD